MQRGRATPAIEIARRAAKKIRHELESKPAHAVDLGAIVEAEIRSAEGTPPEGVVELRLDFGEGVFALAAVVEAEAETATEREILASLRGKLLEALGMAPS